MKISWRMAILVMSMTVIGCGRTAEPQSRLWSIQDDIVYGTPPPASADRWIRLTDVGPRNSPPVIVWIFPGDPGSYERERAGWEKLVILPKSKYETLAAFVRTNRCPTLIDENTGWNTKHISELSNERVEVLCVLPCEKVHGYIEQMLATLGIELASPEAKVIGLMNPSSCNR